MNDSMTFRQPTWQLLVGVLLVTLVPGNAFAEADNQPGYALYAASGTEHQVYQPLDHLTLEDSRDVESLAFQVEFPQIAMSADGTTSVVIDPSQGPLEDWISVRDGLTGPERLTIDVEHAVYNPRLSADGSRVVVATRTLCSPYGCDPRTWYTYDTRTGALISTTDVDLKDYVWPHMIDAAADRLYVPFYNGPPPLSYPATPTPPGISETGPWPLRIAAFDLDTGDEIGRMMAPGVFAGNWLDESMKPAYVTQLVEPAIALSPDGSTIAVVDATMETLTLIDTATLDVTGTHAIHEPESVSERLLGWLGIAPQVAEAKAWEGRTLRATFSVDGRQLYLTGTELEIGETMEDITGHGFGVTMIEVATGEIVREGLADEDIHGVLLSPDGRWLYVQSPVTPWWDEDGQANGDQVLRRLDTETLEPLAERTFDVWLVLKLMPVSADSS